MLYYILVPPKSSNHTRVGRSPWNPPNMKRRLERQLQLPVWAAPMGMGNWSRAQLGMKVNARVFSPLESPSICDTNIQNSPRSGAGQSGNKEDRNGPGPLSREAAAKRTAPDRLPQGYSSYIFYPVSSSDCGWLYLDIIQNPEEHVHPLWPR